jgi:heme exporter protein B
LSSRAGAWLSEAAAVFAKEWRSELRTRAALNTFALFALTTLVVVSAALGPIGARSSERGAVLPVLLWLILLFAATAGLPRGFVHEEETHTATALRLAARPSALFCGKAAYSLALVAALELIVTPLFLVLMQLAVASPMLLVATLAAGGYGLAMGSTLIAAMIGQAQARGTLFAVLSFPVLLPLLIFAVQLSRAAVAGEPPGDALAVLLLYDASITVASLMLFPVIWNP